MRLWHSQSHMSRTQIPRELVSFLTNAHGSAAKRNIERECFAKLILMPEEGQAVIWAIKRTDCDAAYARLLELLANPQAARLEQRVPKEERSTATSKESAHAAQGASGSKREPRSGHGGTGTRGGASTQYGAGRTREEASWKRGLAAQPAAPAAHKAATTPAKS